MGTESVKCDSCNVGHYKTIKNGKVDLTTLNCKCGKLQRVATDIIDSRKIFLLMRESEKDIILSLRLFFDRVIYSHRQNVRDKTFFERDFEFVIPEENGEFLPKENKRRARIIIKELEKEGKGKE